MANSSCTSNTLKTSQMPMKLSICTSDDYYSVYLSVQLDDPNLGYTVNYTATLQRANQYDAWAEDLMTKSGNVSASNSSSHISFDNIAKKNLPVRVKVVTNYGTFYSNTWIR